MSDRMTPITFAGFMNWILEEKKTKGTVFGIRKPYIADAGQSLEIFGRALETPFGPAAGPHTQLCQNLVAAYWAGSRFFELKTVQILDGEDLPVSKPCIKADDECYNVEWSTELYVPQAFDEYVKAWMAIKVLSKEFGLGSPDGFQFNMSVGYDLEGIKSEKIDRFIEGLKDASETPVFRECREWLLANLERFEHITREDVEGISPNVCNSITLSTLHGCPPAEIERIATYLITEKKLNTFIKCNPTLLGYEFARKTMDDMGYDYVAFGDFHFKDDLQYEDAVPMLHRLQELADAKGLAFGVKLTNTFPVDIKASELPGEEMYMSGRSLYPLSIALAARLSKEFGGKLRISYSGGADTYNIRQIFDTGIWPITVATTVLKPGGYQRMVQIAQLLAQGGYRPYTGVDERELSDLAEASRQDRHHKKAVKPLPSRKMKKKVPLMDCFAAPCKEGCPIHQDITSYMKLTGEGKYKEAMEVITDKNPLPFITGTICAHNCMSKCTRNFYEEPVHIRDMKLKAAEGGYDQLIAGLTKPRQDQAEPVAVVGGGPAGIAAAYFLARAGRNVTLFEKRDSLGGVVRYVIPEFRIPSASIDKDVALMEKMGVEVKLNQEIKTIASLKEMGYDKVILAVGASKPGLLNLEKGEAVNALAFLEEFKKTDGHLNLGSEVVVIGGGNTAMDAARAAKRADAVKKVSLVYRRTKRYMPADAEELELAMEDGVEFAELLSPVSLEGNVLVCNKMKLGDADASGRRRPVETGEKVRITADTVIAATGEQVNGAWYQVNGILTDDRGRAKVNAQTLETSVEGVYVAGDGVNGPATVVEAIRDASLAAAAILGASVGTDREETGLVEAIADKKGVLKEAREAAGENYRCLECGAVCENCADVCPNRANISVKVPGMQMAQIIHVDYMCNECGNCASFCPYDSAPYKEKFTLFADAADFADSENEGFVVLDQEAQRVKVRFTGKESEVDLKEGNGLPEQLVRLMRTVICDYAYLLGIDAI